MHTFVLEHSHVNIHKLINGFMTTIFLHAFVEGSHNMVVYSFKSNKVVNL